MKYDTSGLILVTADHEGQFLNVYQIIVYPIEFVVLGHGVKDEEKITTRGTTHIYAINTAGGKAIFQSLNNLMIGKLLYSQHNQASLFTVLKHHNYFGIDAAFDRFEQTESGIVARHGMNIVHGDLNHKTLIGNEFEIEVAAFGSSKVIDEKNNYEEKYTDVGAKHYKLTEFNGEYFIVTN